MCKDRERIIYPFSYSGTAVFRNGEVYCFALDNKSAHRISFSLNAIWRQDKERAIAMGCLPACWKSRNCPSCGD